MGGKIPNQLTEKDVTPIFQVLSDLERPSTSQFFEDSCCHSLYSEYNDLVVHHRDDSSLSVEEYPTVIRVAGVENLAESNHHEVVLRSSFRRISERRKLRMRNESGSLIVRPGSSRRRSKKHKSKPTLYSPDRNKMGMFSSMELESYQKYDFDTISNNDKSDCPTYEVPRDVISITEKSHKRSKKTKTRENSNPLQFSAEDRSCKKDKRKCKLVTKKIIKKYEEMLESLLRKSQENDSTLLKKNDQIEKLKTKLKTLMSYNNQFADENDYMRKQHEDMKACIDHYKTYCASLEDQHDKMEVSNSEKIITATCANCSANEIANIKYEKSNAALNEDILLLKNVVYRLNVQISRYQEKLRNVNDYIMKTPGKTSNLEKNLSMPSLPNFQQAEISSDDIENTKDESKINPSDTSSNIQMVWGDVNSHTLAPLLNAYQESIVEKDLLVRDYEKEFNRFTSKLKIVVEENDTIHQVLSKMGRELASVKEISGLAIAERDSLRKECEQLKNKNVELETALKNITESYQQKMDTMTRDFSLIHQEYFKTKTGLATIQGKCQILENQNKDLQKDSQVPVKVHNMRIDECKKLFDELRQRYDSEKNKLSTRISIMQDSNTQMEKKIIQITGEKIELDNRMKNYIKIAKKCQHDLASVKAELAATQSSRDVFKRRSNRAINLCKQLVLALNKTANGNKNIKAEKLVAQKEVMKNLDIVENKLREQEKTMAVIKSENVEKIEKLQDELKEKDALIKAMKQHIDGERLKKYSNMNPYGKTVDEIIKKNSMKIPPTKPARNNFSSTDNK